MNEDGCTWILLHEEFTLAGFRFAKQSMAMKSNWAEENLQTIRTLMERSAIYRRALAPIMLCAGTIGIVAATVGILMHLNSTTAFGLLWLTTALVTVIVAFLIARRQALKDHEVFWSSPTRRVAVALFPPLLAGFCLGGWPTFFPNAETDVTLCSTLVWIMFYGCALHSAGFFMPRGIRVFGWIFMISAVVFCFLLLSGKLHGEPNAHGLMGFFFGVLHLAYGVYLYFTEKKNPAV